MFWPGENINLFGKFSNEWDIDNSENQKDDEQNFDEDKEDHQNLPEQEVKQGKTDNKKSQPKS